LYHFTNNCKNQLDIEYKTKIACNSKFNTHKDFHSFIKLNLSINGKLVYTVYKDLKNEDINLEIQKGYNKLCKKINL
jgi:hypothetical protein